MNSKIISNLRRFWPVFVPGIIQAIFASYVAHNVSFEIWGRFVLIQLISNLIMLLLSQMLTETAARFHYSNECSFILSDSATLHLIYLAVGLIFFVYPVSIIAEVDFSLLSIMLVATTLYSHSGLIAQYNLLSGKSDTFGICKVSEAISKYFIPIALFQIQSTVDMLIWSSLITAILFSLFSIYLSNLRISFTFNSIRLKKYLIFSNQILFIIPLAWIVTSSDRIFIKINLGYADVGIYAILASIAALIGAVGQLYSFIVTPNALRLHSIDVLQSYTYIRLALIRLLFVLAFLISLSTVIPDSIYALFLGDSLAAFQSNRLTFTLLLASSALAILQSALGIFLSLGKELNINTRAYFIGALLNILLNLSLVRYGILYAAFSTLISYFAIVIYIAIRVNSRYVKIFSLKG